MGRARPPGGDQGPPACFHGRAQNFLATVTLARARRRASCRPLGFCAGLLVRNLDLAALREQAAAGLVDGLAGDLVTMRCLTTFLPSSSRLPYRSCRPSWAG